MGYNIEQRSVSFHVAASLVPAVIEAVRVLVATDSLTWVRWDNVDAAVGVTEVLRACRWSPYVDDNGDITSLWFRGEKAGSDLRLFQAIAPFVKAGSYITMEGEDGAVWQYQFNGQECLEVKGSITFVPDGMMASLVPSTGAHEDTLAPAIAGRD